MYLASKNRVGRRTDGPFLVDITVYMFANMGMGRTKVVFNNCIPTNRKLGTDNGGLGYLVTMVVVGA